MRLSLEHKEILLVKKAIVLTIKILVLYHPTL